MGSARRTRAAARGPGSERNSLHLDPKRRPRAVAWNARRATACARGNEAETRRKAAAGVVATAALTLARPREPPRAGPPRVRWQRACTSIAHGRRRHPESEPPGRCVVSDDRAAMAAADRDRDGLVRRPRRGAGAAATASSPGLRIEWTVDPARGPWQTVCGYIYNDTPAAPREVRLLVEGRDHLRADHRFSDRARARVHRALGSHVLLLDRHGRSRPLLGHHRRGSRDR